MPRAGQDISHPVEKLFEVRIGESVHASHENQRPGFPQSPQSRLSQRRAQYSFIVANVEDDRIRLPPEPVQMKNRVARLEAGEGDLLRRVLPSNRQPLNAAVSQVVVVRGEDRGTHAPQRVDQFELDGLEAANRIGEPALPLLL